MARWGALTVPVGLVIGFYAGLYVGWWGHGLGDGWPLAAMVMLAVITCGASVAIAVARGGRRSESR